MIIGLPHSSQSISVVIGYFGPAAVVVRLGFSARIFAMMSALSAAPSFSSGVSASICFLSSGDSLVIAMRPRHFGYLLQPSHGPRLPSRKYSGEPQVLHAIDVVIGLGLGGSGLPSLSRLMIVEQLGSPFSFFTE